MGSLKREKIMGRHIFVFCRYLRTTSSGIQTYIDNLMHLWKSDRIDLISSKIGRNAEFDPWIHVHEIEKDQGCNHMQNVWDILKIFFKSNSDTFSWIKLFLLVILNRDVLNRSMSRIKETIRLCEKEGLPDYTICSLVLEDGFLGVILRHLYGIPYIVLLQGSELIHFNESLRYKKLMLYVFEHAKVIISNSEYMKNFYYDFSKLQSKVITTHLGVDLKSFLPLEPNHGIAAKLGLQSHNKIVLTVSNIVPRKGIDVLLKAIHKIKEDFPEIIYLIVGGNSPDYYKKKLDTIIEELSLKNNVIWVGPVEHNELALYYSLCDVFVLPARDEAFGLVTLEANACNKAVVGSDTGGITETIINKETGLLFKNEDDNDLADKLRSILSDDDFNRFLRFNAYSRVIKEYSWPAIIENMQREIEGMIQ